MIQQCFILVRITEIVIGKRFSHNTINKQLSTFRKFVAYNVLIPNAFFVASLFWFIYIYEREWVYPKEFDNYVPPWHNHVVHTLILLPAIIELLLSKSDCNVHLSYWTSFVVLNALGATYQIL